MGGGSNTLGCTNYLSDTRADSSQEQLTREWEGLSFAPRTQGAEAHASSGVVGAEGVRKEGGESKGRAWVRVSWTKGIGLEGTSRRGNGRET
jgi:hypothetical protein